MSQTLRGAYESFRKDVLPGLCRDNNYRLGSDISVTYVPGKHIDVMLSDSAEVSGLQSELGTKYEDFPIKVTSA